MNHHIAWIVIQAEHRARHAHAEKYGTHAADLRRQSPRRRRVWTIRAIPRIRRRRPTVSDPVVGACAPSVS